MHIQAENLFESITKGIKLNNMQKINLKLACLRTVLDNDSPVLRRQIAKIHLSIILDNPDASKKLIYPNSN